MASHGLAQETPQALGNTLATAIDKKSSSQIKSLAHPGRARSKMVDRFARRYLELDKPLRYEVSVELAKSKKNGLAVDYEYPVTLEARIKVVGVIKDNPRGTFCLLFSGCQT